MGNQESLCACWVDSPELVSTSQYRAVYPTYVVDEETELPQPKKLDPVYTEQELEPTTTGTMKNDESESNHRVVKRKGETEDPPQPAAKRALVQASSSNHVGESTQGASRLPSRVASRISVALTTTALNGDSLPQRRVARASIGAMRGIAIYEADFKSFSSMSSVSGDPRESRLERGTSRGGEHSREDVEEVEGEEAADDRDDCWEEHGT